MAGLLEFTGRARTAFDGVLGLDVLAGRTLLVGHFLAFVLGLATAAVRLLDTIEVGVVRAGVLLTILVDVDVCLRPVVTVLLSLGTRRLRRRRRLGAVG